MIPPFASGLTIVCVAGIIQLSTGAFVAEVVKPDNGTIVARPAGSLDPAVIICNIRNNLDNSPFTTTWTIQNYIRTDQTYVTQSNFGGIVEIDGDLQFFGHHWNYRNVLTIVNFTEKLDGTVLRCKYPTKEMSVNEGIFYLLIREPPHLLNLSEVVDVLEHVDYSVNLKAHPRATPYPTSRTWTRNGKSVSNSTTAKFGYWSASFTNVSRSDSGHYILTVVIYKPEDPSAILSTKVGTFKLNVKFGPELHRGPKNILGAENQDIQLVCGTHVTSNPVATVQWFDNHGRPVNMADDKFSGSSLLVLQISKVTPADIGLWTCIVTAESVGNIHIIIKLTLQSPPPRPTDVTVISTNSTAIKVVWTSFEWTPNASTKSSATILYNVMATAPSIADLIRVQVNSSDAIVSQLFPNTQYRVTVTTLMCIGTLKWSSRPSKPVSVITKATVPELTCFRASSESGFIQLRWSFRHSGGTDLEDLSVSYAREKPLNFQPVQYQRVQLDNGGQPIGMNLWNITAGIAYHFRITATNNQGHIMVMCPTVTPSTGVPQTPQIHDGNSSQVNVTLVVSTNASGRHFLEFFQFKVRVEHVHKATEEIYFSLDANDYIDGKEIHLNLQLSDFPVKEQNTTFNFYVSCQNSFGRSYESEPLTETVQFRSSLPEATRSLVQCGVMAMLVTFL